MAPSTFTLGYRGSCMNLEKRNMIQEVVKGVIPYIDQLPMGQIIPSTWEAPEGFKLKKCMVGEIPVEHLIPDEKGTNRIVLQLHGGGYVVALCDPFRDCAVQYSKMAGGAEVFSVDYRTAPTYHYPAALEDAVAAYQWLLDKGYDANQIIIVGDSAGGNLTLATTLYLKDHGMPLPKAIIAISPWANPANDFDSIQSNAELDVILGKYGLGMGKQIEEPFYFEGADLKEAYASPVLGNYIGFPHLLIQVGSYEILLDDALKTAENARLAGAPVRQTIYPEMSHDFQLLIPMLEESGAAWKEMQDFVNEAFEK